MTSKLFVGAALLAGCIACQPDRTTETKRAKEEVAEAVRATQREAESARAELARRVDKLDSEIEKLEKKAEKSSGKAKAKLRVQAREMRQDARKLRDRVSTWDDKVETAWRSTKREVEEGLDKAENSIKKLVDDLKN